MDKPVRTDLSTLTQEEREEMARLCAEPGLRYLKEIGFGDLDLFVEADNFEDHRFGFFMTFSTRR